MTSTVSTGVRPGHTIHDRMRHWAEADPHRVAIRFGDDEITYAALSRRSAVAYVVHTSGLCHGATLWLAPRTIRQDPRSLLAAMEDAAPTVAEYAAAVHAADRGKGSPDAL